MSLRKTYEDQLKQKEQLQRSTELAEQKNVQRQQSLVEELTDSLEKENQENLWLKRKNTILTNQNLKLDQENLKLMKRSASLARHNREYRKQMEEKEKDIGELLRQVKSKEDYHQTTVPEDRKTEWREQCRDSRSDRETIERLQKKLKEKEEQEGRDRSRIADLERYNREKEKEINNLQNKPIVASIWLVFGTLALSMASHSEAFAGDFKAAYQTIEGFLWEALKAFIELGETASQISEGISQAIVALIVHWIIRVTIPAVLIGAVAALIIFLVYEAYKIFVHGLKFADGFSLTVFLSTICLVAGFAKPLQGILPGNLNLIVLIMIIQALYIFFRMIVNAEELKYGRW